VDDLRQSAACERESTVYTGDYIQLKMAHRFEIVREIRRDYRRFGTVGKQFTVRLNPPSDYDLNPIDHFLASVNELFEHVLHDVQDSEMVGSLFETRLTRAIKL
jgi:hypothetical protein